MEASGTGSQIQVKVAMATWRASGAKPVMEYFVEQLEGNIEAVVSQTGCIGYCYEPTIKSNLTGVVLVMSTERAIRSLKIYQDRTVLISYL